MKKQFLLLSLLFQTWLLWGAEKPPSPLQLLVMYSDYKLFKPPFSVSDLQQRKGATIERKGNKVIVTAPDYIVANKNGTNTKVPNRKIVVRYNHDFSQVTQCMHHQEETDLLSFLPVEIRGSDTKTFIGKSPNVCTECKNALSLV